MRNPIKPSALVPGAMVRIMSLASPPEGVSLRRGVAELERLGYGVRPSRGMKPDGYFAGGYAERLAELELALRDADADALICSRGGYGTAALLEELHIPRALRPKLVVGYSDATALLAFIWQRLRWTTLYGPMVAAGFDKGADQPCGYDRASFLNAASGACGEWSLTLSGDALARGKATGVLLGGCVTLLETLLGTPWELDTRGAILLLEDRGVKPYQLDRMLVHLAQAGKLLGVRGFVLGDFPDCDPPPGPAAAGVTVRDVCRRILGPLHVPVVFGAPVGHTARPMLTLPLGVRVRLHAAGEGKLDILESAVQRRS